MTGWRIEQQRGFKLRWPLQEQGGSFYAQHTHAFVVFVNEIRDLTWHNSQIVPLHSKNDGVKEPPPPLPVCVWVRKEQQHSQQRGIRDSRKMMSSEQTKVFGQSPNKQHLPQTPPPFPFCFLILHRIREKEKKSCFSPPTRAAPHYLTAGIHQEQASVARGKKENKTSGW